MLSRQRRADLARRDAGISVPTSPGNRLFFTHPSLRNTPEIPIPPAEPPTPSKPTLQKENIYTLPNALTLTRIAISPVIGYHILHANFTTALSLLTFAAITDLVDGWMARNWNMKTFLGSALDPMADKVLMTVLTVSLAGAGLVPVPLAALILLRDVGLVLGTAYYRYASLPPPKTASRYFDLSLPSAEVQPPMISKLNTLFQLLLMGLSTAAPVFGFVDHVALIGLQWLVAITTVWSGLHYVVYKNVVVMGAKGKGV
ncbi:hypothetical protein HDV00_010699 [Rhizophlyctis rosea]|nr:hypothetical protein HDV00_010699 [Rhizophlyctis rosea]